MILKQNLNGCSFLTSTALFNIKPRACSPLFKRTGSWTNEPMFSIAIDNLLPEAGWDVDLCNQSHLQ